MTPKKPRTDTPPARFTRRNHGSGHSYRLDGHKIPGVTTVIGKLDKPALTQWAANMAADYALDEWDTLGELRPSERHKAIASAHRNTVRKAAVRGTRLHTFGEKLAHGEQVDVPDEYRLAAEAYARFLDDWEITTELTEIPVCHSGHRYAGTLDAIVEIPRLGRVLLDVKTGKGVYREVALQTAAYRFADLALIDGVESDMIGVDSAAVAHVRPDSVELVPVTAGDTEWRAFLYLLQVHRWIEATADDPVVGRAIHPEQQPVPA